MLRLLLVVLFLFSCTPSAPTLRSSQFVTMRDGTRLALTAWVPEKRTGPVPTILRLTRYWREIDATTSINPDPIEAGRPFVNAGYAWVSVDVRGTGASFGHSDGPWNPAEVEDTRELIEWIIAQPWSNGRIGATGISYEGNTSLLVASLGHPAVKAIVPQFFFFDPYSSVVRPGGVLSARFLGAWSRQAHALDTNDVSSLCAEQASVDCKALVPSVYGVKPVDGPDGPALRSEAIAAHVSNVDIEAAGRAMEFSDDPFGSLPSTALSPAAMTDRFAGSSAAWMLRVGWMDAATVSGALRAWETLPGVSQELVIGSWNHGGAEDADPFRPAAETPHPSVDDQTKDVIAFFDAHLLRDDEPRRSIRYSTLGEDLVRESTSWPPPSVREVTWSFSAGRHLTTGPATGGVEEQVMPSNSTTGLASRWQTPNGGPDVDTGDRSTADASLLSWTSEPLELDRRLTGAPRLELSLTTSTVDDSLFAYLEDVAPDGRVVLLTEGVRRLSLVNGLTRAQATPFVPGATRSFSLSLEPVSAVLRAGHRVRVSLAAHDVDNFTTVVPRDEQRWRVDDVSSRLVLPIDG